MKQTQYFSFLILLIVPILTFSDAVAADTGFYTGATIGRSGLLFDSKTSIGEIDGESGNSGTVLAGYKHKLYKGWFLSGETFYRHVDIDKTFSGGENIKLDSQYGLNAHIGYEWQWGELYTIIGLGRFDYEFVQNGISAGDDNINSFIGIGTSFQISNSLSTTLEYTSASDEISTSSDPEKSIALYSMQVGLRYHF